MCIAIHVYHCMSCAWCMNLKHLSFLIERCEEERGGSGEKGEGGGEERERGEEEGG